ncbi:MAG: 23S rRNA (pseudouridine(1915)-N(3))-methyltransferase RlmH [Clostridia bacterium]|nr:23S rRNA (pseudouridine(1915)-N(3))-methyltransferase RlmH [Clostridia bacterium]
MFKIKVVAVGKVKEKYFLDAILEYKKRLSRFCDVSICEVKEENFTKEPNSSEISEILKREGESILKELKGYVVAMAIEGKKCSSEGLAKLIKNQVDKGQEITFVIGGSYGICDEVKTSADMLLSFSDATFPHTLFRVMLLEQVYRAFSINADARYHK